jgi:hypothetical protein
MGAMEFLLTLALILVFALSTYYAEFTRFKKRNGLKKGRKVQSEPKALLGVVYPRTTKRTKK